MRNLYQAIRFCLKNVCDKEAYHFEAPACMVYVATLFFYEAECLPVAGRLNLKNIPTSGEATHIDTHEWTLQG